MMPWLAGNREIAISTVGWTLSHQQPSCLIIQPLPV
jgi:hypothetical protein